MLHSPRPPAYILTVR